MTTKAICAFRNMLGTLVVVEESRVLTKESNFVASRVKLRRNYGRVVLIVATFVGSTRSGSER